MCVVESARRCVSSTSSGFVSDICGVASTCDDDVSLEAIFLSTFVTISQNRADEKRHVIAERQWRTVQEDEQQNETLLCLSNEILGLNKEIHTATRAAEAVACGGVRRAVAELRERLPDGIRIVVAAIRPRLLPHWWSDHRAARFAPYQTGRQPCESPCNAAAPVPSGPQPASTATR